MGSKVEIRIQVDTPSQLMGSPAEQNLSATLSSFPILPGSRPGHRAHMYCGYCFI